MTIIVSFGAGLRMCRVRRKVSSNNFASVATTSVRGPLNPTFNLMGGGTRWGVVRVRASVI